MKTEDCGAEAFTEQDRAYNGSRFTKVRDAVLANPYQQVWGREGSGPGLLQNVSFSNWRRIGQLTFDNAVASYNGDFFIHLNHPTWRNDRNDPATATRMNGRKVPKRADVCF